MWLNVVLLLSALGVVVSVETSPDRSPRRHRWGSTTSTLDELNRLRGCIYQEELEKKIETVAAEVNSSQQQPSEPEVTSDERQEEVAALQAEVREKRRYRRYSVLSFGGSSLTAVAGNTWLVRRDVKSLGLFGWRELFGCLLSAFFGGAGGSRS